mmetsp:Transcript_16065/g.24386  ORF Transcript_16065/g.24386 Transcript_16065/m.24386 type:complete len:301 (-) Transcript_16065:42-944(-)
MSLQRTNFLFMDHVVQDNVELPRVRRCCGDILRILAATHEDVILRVFLGIVERRDSSIVERSICLVSLDAFVLFVHSPELRTSVFPTREHEHPVLSEGDVADWALVGIEGRHLLTVDSIPDDDGAFLEDRHQSLIEGAPLDLAGRHRKLLVDGKQLLDGLELPDADPVGNRVRRALHLVVARHYLVLTSRHLVELHVLHDTSVRDRLNLLTSKSVEEHFAVGLGSHYVLAVHGDVDSRDCCLITGNSISSNSFACVCSNEAAFSILGSCNEEIAVVVEFDSRNRPLMQVKYDWLHGCPQM